MKLRHSAGLILFGLGVWILLPLDAGGQADDKKPEDRKPAEKSKASEEDIRKAREEVKRLADEVDKQADKLYETHRNLRKAQDKLDELEGRPYRRRVGDFRGGVAPGRDRRPEPPKLEPKAAAEVEKRLDRIKQDLDDIRKEIRKTTTPPSKERREP